MPIFAEFGLQPIWDIYQGVATASQAMGQASALLATNSSFGGSGGSLYNGNNNDSANGSSSSSSNNNNNSAKNKIKADSPGMDMVLEAMQIGPATTGGGKKGDQAAATAMTITTQDDLKSVLTKTGANTEESVLRCVLRRFRPLATTILDVVCDYCPSPSSSSPEQGGDASRMTIRSKPLSLQVPTTTQPTAEFQEIQRAVQTCDHRSDAPAVAYVCKFFSTERSHVRDAALVSSPSAANATTNNGHKNDESLLLGLTRVLSGRLQTGQAYHVLGPKHTENSPTPLKRAIRLYLLMGSSFVRVDEVPAGHLCAVFGLEDVQLKNLTLSDRPNAMPLSMSHMMHGTARIRPLVKVNIEAKQSSDVEELDRGLLKLSLADAAVEVTATARGERILACLGELHLEQSLMDLKNVYCARSDIELRTSDPIVDFGETTDWFPSEVSDYKSLFSQATSSNNNASTPHQPRQSTIPPFNEEEGLSGAKFGRSRAVVSGRSAALRLRVVPLAESVHKAFQEKKLHDTEGGNIAVDDDLAKNVRNLAKALGFEVTDSEVQDVFNQLLDCLASVGTNGNALMQTPNLKSGTTVFGLEANENGEVYIPPADSDKGFAENVPDYDEQEVTASGKIEYEKLSMCLKDYRHAQKMKENCIRNQSLDEEATNVWKKMSGSAVAGFQLALRAGPLCEEPLRNVLVVLEGVEIAMKPKGDSGTEYEPAKTLSSGMIVSSLRSGIRCALLTRPARLMEGYLRLTLNATLAGLGALYSVLSKRRGKVLDDSMVDGTDLLAITALIPQAEAFGLAPELFAKTSGEVTAPEMTFSHWERLDVDPFWIPTTEEEREDYGELQTAGDSSTGMDNTALTYIRQVRERKGLKVDSSRTVVAAEKQRTLKR